MLQSFLLVRKCKNEDSNFHWFVILFFPNKWFRWNCHYTDCHIWKRNKDKKKRILVKYIFQPIQKYTQNLLLPFLLFFFLLFKTLDWFRLKRTSALIHCNGGFALFLPATWETDFGVGVKKEILIILERKNSPSTQLNWIANRKATKPSVMSTNNSFIEFQTQLPDKRRI